MHAISKTRQPRKANTPPAPPPITSPEFAAFLLYVTGAQSDSRDEGHTYLARLAANARRILDCPDATAIFDGLAGHNASAHDCVKADLASQFQRDELDTDRERRRVIAQILADDPDEDLTTRTEYVADALDSAISEAFYLGAAVGFLILKGGAK